MNTKGRAEVVPCTLNFGTKHNWSASCPYYLTKDLFIKFPVTEPNGFHYWHCLPQDLHHFSFQQPIHLRYVLSLHFIKVATFQVISQPKFCILYLYPHTCNVFNSSQLSGFIHNNQIMYSI